MPSSTQHPVSRQQAVGTAVRAETRRRLLDAAGEEFTEHGYTAATVGRIAQRAGVTVQTLYLAWGSKRALLHGFIESVLAGSVGAPDDVIERFSGVGATALTDKLAIVFGDIAARSAIAWKLYRDAAAVDSDIAEDWRELQEMRRTTMRRIVALIPVEELRTGLTPISAADTAWVIASPESYDLLVRPDGHTLDEYVSWVASTLRAAILH